jgi:hypothetical protein
MAEEVATGRARASQHRRRLLRHHAGPHQGHRRGRRGMAAPRQAPEIEPACRLSGLEPCNITADSFFVNVGERTNVTGSARFKRLIKEGDYDTALESWPWSRSRTAPRSSTSTWTRACSTPSRPWPVPEPGRRRAGHRPRAGDDRLLQVGGHRGRAQVRPGQGHRQLDLLKEGEEKFIEQAGCAGATAPR